MANALHILGVRHHGPGSARMVVRALEVVRPEVVLIEGPPDAAEVVALAADRAMRPPVALLVYEPDDLQAAAYYPFAEFSPEWQALRWALANGKQVRFIDLPLGMRAKQRAEDDENSPGSSDGDGNESAHDGDDPPTAPTATAAASPSDDPREDPLDALAVAAGFADGEAWWGRMIEENRGDEDPIGVFDAIRGAMESARREIRRARDPEEAPREAHMRKMIRAAVKETDGAVAVICGAWHAPVLTEAALKEHTTKADDATLKGLTKRKTAATWIPWTYDRLSMFSGYGAGVASPGWYEHLWIHHAAAASRISEGWLTRVARLMREADLDASPASVIEAVRLAESLAALRGRRTPSLEELGEATLAILCHGDRMPLAVIERDLIVGRRLGEVPDSAPMVPLQRDLLAQQKSLRMKVSADDVELDLDQRKDIDLARSRLLHRLAILDVPWGELKLDQRQRTSTFHEVWRLQWKPEFAIALMEAARWGNTVAEAAAGFIAHKAAAAGSLAELTALLDHVMLADLPAAVERLVSRIAAMAAVGVDVGHLMEALPPLAAILRYGNVRKTDAALVEPVVAGLTARICAGLLPGCASLDDDAAAIMRGRIEGVHSALTMLGRAELTDPWRETLAKVGDADVHGLVAGRAWRLLLDTGAEPEEAATRLALALSPGADPAAASAWLEGFLTGSGLVLVHDARLLGIVDQWVCSLPRETFERVCPIGRRTFATFEAPERRQIGERLKRGGLEGDGVGQRPSKARAGDGYNAERGALVEPVLRLILGERFVGERFADGGGA